MTWSAAKKSGFVLGALLGGDRELANVSRALDPELRAALLERALAVPREPPAEKARALRELVGVVRPALADVSALPARAQALLARSLPRGAARSVAQPSTPSRHDFAADKSLLGALERIARHGTEPSS